MEKFQFCSDYVARYEYACSLVVKFFERELLLNNVNQDERLFATNSAAQILFTTDYSKLCVEKVRSQIITQLANLSRNEDNFLLSRVHGVIVDIYAVLGSQFVQELITNTAHGISAAGSIVYPDKDELGKITDVLNKHQELLVFILGSKLYQTEFINRKRIEQMAKTKVV